MEPQAAAPSPQTTEDVVFDNTVDGLFRRALGKKMSAKCRDRLKAAGLDLENKLQPKYPRLRYYEFVNIAAEELFAGKAKDEAHYELGRAFIDGFQETLLGRTVAGMAKLLGPKRTLARMTQNMQSSNNYMKTSLKELGPGRYEILLSQVSGAPGYFRGVLQAAMEIVGASNPRVSLLRGDGTSAEYSVVWDEAAKA